MITRALVIKLGLGQLISWGTAYYLIGNFGTLIAQHHGWSSSVVYAGFSASLLTMAVISPFCGRMIDRHGGRIIMTMGSCLNALGCLILAFADQQVLHFIGWIILGLAMRATLYDAAFATLARIGGRDARRAMGQITLFGGLASTVFWPLGHLIQSEFGISIALVAYAGFALLTVPMYAAIPDARHGAPSGTTLNSTDNTNDTSNADDHGLATHQRLCGFLYAVIVTLLNVVNAAMSAHMIAILIGLGLTTAAAINAASLRGIGQSAARAAEILFGKRIAPASLTLFATAVLPLCFVLAFWGDQFALAAMTFTLLYGAANGVLTITRGTLPLMIFGNARYGHQVGRLLVPGFILSALAPSLYERAIALLACACGAAMWLYLLLRPQSPETRPAPIT